MQVSIIMFNGCDLLDTGGPYEVFHTASRLAERDGTSRPYEVDTVTVDGEMVSAYGGLGLTPTAQPDLLDRSDVVIIPGAIDMEPPLGDSALLEVIQRNINRAGVVTASVCTGAFLLGEIGALDGKSWTTHWEDIDALGQRLGADGQGGMRWIDAGSIVTAGGLSSGIAMSLHLVARTTNEELAQRTAVQLDYDWTNTSMVS